MTKKYIIKNCPGIFTYEDENMCCDSEIPYCKDRTVCLLKQIVEKCKPHLEICKECDSDDCFECEHLTGGQLGNKIISLLEIQECE
jgi:hypothetical protein